MFAPLFILSTVIIGVIVGTFMAVATSLVPHPVSFTAPDAFPNNAQVSLRIELVSADPVARTFTMDWYAVIPSDGCNSNINQVADIYLYPGVLDPSTANFSVLPPYSPVYRYNVTAVCWGDVPAFRTATKLVSSESQGFGGPEYSSIQNYPFDIYFAPFYLYALDPDNDHFVVLNITKSFGEIVNFTTELFYSGITVKGNSLFFVLRLTRTKATKIFVVLVGVINWLIATVFIVICVSTVTYPSHKIYSEIFVLPVGAVFAFTAIRAGFPGAPTGFGANIDLYTILPVLVVISLCSLFLLLRVLFCRIYESIEQSSDGTSKPALGIKSGSSANVSQVFESI